MKWINNWTDGHNLLIYSSGIDTVEENFGGVETARKLAEKTLAVGKGKAHSILEFRRPHDFLADKTLAD